jgi:putative intracellular protease/amidase
LKLDDVNAADYDAIFYPGGHGPLWDLTNDTTSIGLIETFFNVQARRLGLSVTLRQFC